MLDYALKQVHSAYPLIALYNDAFPPEGHKALDLRGIRKRRITHLLPAGDRDYSNDPRFVDTWTKLSVFELVEFQRVVLLDSDMLVRQNMDELMDIELDSPAMEGKGNRIFAASHACVCNPMKKPHYPKNWYAFQTRLQTCNAHISRVPTECAFTHQHADPALAQTEGRPSSDSHGIPNSGLVVLNPCEGAFQQVLKQLKNEDAVKSYIFPDQELLGDIFRGRWVTIPYIYNALKTMRSDGVHDKIWRDDKVKNVHYIFSPKPWNEKPEDVTNPIHSWWHDMNAQRLRSEQSQSHSLADGF